MSDTHYLGEFQSLSAVWKMFPNGAGYGDYITIGGVRYDWDESTNSWGEDPGDVNPALPEIVNHDIDVQGTVIARDGIKTADYIPDEAGANIDHAGNAEFRTLKADTVRVQDPLTGKLIPLAEFIKMFKTELPPDWSEYAQIPQFDDVRILAFDPISDEKYYTTIGALKQLIRDSIAAGGVGTGTFDIEILRTDNPDAIPTDNNVMSSLRTLMAIQAAIAPLTGEYLSRINDDTAQGLITFLKGIEVGTFTTGALGSGAAIKMLNGTSYAEVDHLTVRQKATFRELIIEALKHIGGQLVLSPARMKCNKVVDGGTYYKCYFDTGDGEVSNEFVAGDQARCQVFTGSGTKFYWRLVTSVGDDWINLSKTDAVSGSDIPEAGDDIVQLGNRNDTTRQSAIILSTMGADAPSWKQYEGINSFDLTGKDTTRFTRLGNRIQGSTVFTSGGSNLEDVLDGVAGDIQDAQATADGKSTTFLIQPTSYKLGDMWVLNADQTINGIAYKQGDILTATQDSETYNQAHWVKRVRYTDDTAVNELEIGGRNYYHSKSPISYSAGVGGYVTRPHAETPNGFFILGTTTDTNLGNTRIYNVIKSNGLWTVKFKAKANGTVGMGIDACDSPIQTIALTTNWQTYELTFNVTNWSADIYNFVDFGQLRYAYYWIDDLIVAKGNKVTDWTEAPEDTQARIDSAKQEALDASNNVQTNVNNLNTYVDGSFKNGIIDSAEAKAIEKYLNSLSETKLTLDASYTQVYGNTYLEGTAKSNLLSAKTALNTAYTNLITSITTAIADGKTTVAEKNDVDSKFGLFNTALVTYQTRLEEANKAIQAKLDAIAKGYVDNLQIGGRNLITSSTNINILPLYGVNGTYISVANSSVPSGVVFTATNLNRSIGTYAFFLPLTNSRARFKVTNGERVTVSFYIKTNVTQILEAPGFNLYTEVNSTWKKVQHNFIYPSSGNLHYTLTGADLTSFEVHSVKMERGAKATDWTPAPEDVESEINTAKAEAGNAQTTANSLKNFTDTAFRDGIIDRSESVAIEKYKNSLNEAMSKAEASYNKVYTNTYLEGAAKTSLLNAKVNLWGQRDTLLSAINTAISGGITTPAQKTAVDNAFNTFNNLMTAFQNALEEANKAIQAKLDAISKGYVDNLEIGGRNLFEWNKISYSDTNWELSNEPYELKSKSALSSLSTFYVSPFVEVGEQYTISFEIKASASGIAWENSTLYLNSANVTTHNNPTLTPDKYARVQKTFTWKTGGTGRMHIYISGLNTTTNYVLLRNIQIEKGNKATDWSPAPEDVQAEIDSAKLTAEQAQLQAEGYMRARYVRDWAKGNSDNNANNWNEIKVVNKSGTNLALGKTPSTNGVWNASLPSSNITDGNENTGAYISNATPTLNYAEIDLGQVHYDIDYIHIWHARTAQGRTYSGTKTEISEDGVNWTTIFDSATEGTYKETAEGKIHTQRYASVMAKMNRAAATTDKFSGFDGGLATAVIMEMREPSTTTRGDATAFISGMQGALKNLPAFGAGATTINGVYADALAGLAKIIFRHDGTGKIGVFEVDEVGSIKIYDPDIVDLLRLEFIKSKIPTVASLLSQTQEGQSVTNVAKMFISSGSAVLPNSINVTEDSAELSFSGTMELDVTFDELNGATSGSAYVGVALYKDGYNYANLGTLNSGQLSNSNYSYSNSVQINKKLTVPKGVYTIVVSASFNDAIGSAGINSTSTLSWILRKDIRRFIFGSDGFASWYTENSFHFSELTGMFARGKVDIPAGLGGGRVTSGGGVANPWGLVAGGARASNIVTINHNIGDTRYTVNVALNGSSSSWYFQNRTNTSVQVVCSGAFDFTLIRTPV